ncbi:MAG TPA: HoxN/HupN/NixA family nickel/cobalt transporter [Amycolatopsis sp.]|nr:HoxN/HupN/NixA family nickel/cobalt transporter [Amycolatopsis sp.]
MGNRAQLGRLFAVIAVMHLVAWGTLVFAVAPHGYRVGTEVFGIGLGITAYTLGMRHAFDADHIAAIDNVTRRLMADGRKSASVGFWFALGHSSVVLLLAGLLTGGIRLAGTLLDDNSSARATLGTVGTIVSGGFLLLLAVLNLIALAGVVRLWKKMRQGWFDAAELELVLSKRGLINRILRGLTRSINRPGQMFAVGLLFGLGFDTATEVTLLVLAGSGAASGLPWYAVAVVPLLFAAGMTLLDTVDGAFMAVAYRWAFAHPARKLYYNAIITGLSVAVAMIIGGIELVRVLHDDLELPDPVTGWIAGLDLNNVGFIVVGLFFVVWLAAIGYWRIAGVEKRLPELASAEER